MPSRLQMYLPKYTCRCCRLVWIPVGQDFKCSISVYVQSGWLCKFGLSRIIPSHLWASPGSASALNSLTVRWSKPLPPTYCCTDSCTGVIKAPRSRILQHWDAKDAAKDVKWGPLYVMCSPTWAGQRTACVTSVPLCTAFRLPWGT